MVNCYHYDNGVFISDHFRSDCQGNKQTNYFLGVGAKHNNGKSERAIKTIRYWARKMITHAALHLKSDNSDSVWLWEFSVTHAAWIYNHQPNKNLGWMSPVEILANNQSDHRDILRAQVWVCPDFVLYPKLQDNQKIPKFNRMSRMGQLLGFSDEHSTLVAMVRNLATNFVIPQFNVVFDGNFSTIQNDTSLEDTAVEAILNDLFINCRDFYGEQGRPLEETISDPEGAAVDIPSQVRW